MRKNSCLFALAKRLTTTLTSPKLKNRQTNWRFFISNTKKLGDLFGFEDHQDGAQTNQAKHDVGGGTNTKKRGHQVILKQPDQTPIQSSNDH